MQNTPSMSRKGGRNATFRYMLTCEVSSRRTQAHWSHVVCAIKTSNDVTKPKCAYTRHEKDHHMHPLCTADSIYSLEDATRATRRALAATATATAAPPLRYTAESSPSLFAYCAGAVALFLFVVMQSWKHRYRGPFPALLLHTTSSTAVPKASLNPVTATPNVGPRSHSLQLVYWRPSSAFSQGCMSRLTV